MTWKYTFKPWKYTFKLWKYTFKAWKYFLKRAKYILETSINSFWNVHRQFVGHVFWGAVGCLPLLLAKGVIWWILVGGGMFLPWLQEILDKFFEYCLHISRIFPYFVQKLCIMSIIGIWLIFTTKIRKIIDIHNFFR